ncbi:MAG TPA: 3-oxoadipate enol-lactonase [Ktedonobacteraceae bacterium]
MPVFLAEGLKIAYRVDGPEDAPPLVLINSLGTNLHIWDTHTEALSSTLRVIRFDERGHGASEPPSGPCTIEQYGNDLLTLLDTLGIARAHLCGLSLGGVIAQWCAIQHPERVLSATFANTAARIGNEQIWDERVAAVQAGGLASILEAVIARFLSANYRLTHPAETQRISEIVMTTSPTGYIAACLALRSADLRPYVSSIHVPTLIIAGELDVSAPPAQAEELHAAIPGSKLIIFPGVAHQSNIERPAEFSAYVLEHLQGTEPANTPA